MDTAVVQITCENEVSKKEIDAVWPKLETITDVMQIITCKNELSKEIDALLRPQLIPSIVLPSGYIPLPVEPYIESFLPETAGPQISDQQNRETESLFQPRVYLLQQVVGSNINVYNEPLPLPDAPEIVDTDRLHRIEIMLISYGVSLPVSLLVHQNNSVETVLTAFSSAFEPMGVQGPHPRMCDMTLTYRNHEIRDKTVAVGSIWDTLDDGAVHFVISGEFRVLDDRFRMHVQVRIKCPQHVPWCDACINQAKDLYVRVSLNTPVSTLMDHICREEKLPPIKYAMFRPDSKQLILINCIYIIRQIVLEIQFLRGFKEIHHILF